MLIKELAAMVHQNAVDHGWWDEERAMPELVALIHSEWSEALEEARAGRPMVYKFTLSTNAEPAYVTPEVSGVDTYNSIHSKPEGVAVELIDGCIRILDVLGRERADILDPDTGFPTEFETLLDKHSMAKPEEIPEDAPTLIAWLHAITSLTLLDMEDSDKTPEVNLIAAMSVALTWVQMQGIDPLALLLEKHEYNKGRPYKHGKKF